LSNLRHQTVEKFKKKHNLSNLLHQTVEKFPKKTMGSSEDPSLVTTLTNWAWYIKG